MKCAARKIGKNKYELTISMGNDGKGHYPRKYKVVNNIKNKGQLEEAQATFIYEVSHKLDNDHTVILFKDLVTEWWDKHASNLSPRTQEGYESNLKLRVLPTFSNQKIDQISRIDIMDFFSRLQKPNCEFIGKKYNLSTKTIDNHKILLNSIFSFAVLRNYIKTSPVKGIKTPKVIIQHKSMYELSDLQKLLRSLTDVSKKDQALIYFAIGSGAREGEIAGLQWKHVNLDKGIVLIEQGVIRKKGGGTIVKPPKSGKSRMIKLPDFSVASLKQHQRERYALDLTNDYTVNPNDFVFSPATNKYFDTPIRPESIGQWWRRFLKRKNLKHIRFHDVRHTAASLLIHENDSPKAISERLGHSGINITMDLYGYLFNDADVRSAQMLDNIFSRING